MQLQIRNFEFIILNQINQFEYLTKGNAIVYVYPWDNIDTTLLYFRSHLLVDKSNNHIHPPDCDKLLYNGLSKILNV